MSESTCRSPSNLYTVNLVLKRCLVDDMRKKNLHMIPCAWTYNCNCFPCSEVPIPRRGSIAGHLSTVAPAVDVWGTQGRKVSFMLQVLTGSFESLLKHFAAQLLWLRQQLAGIGITTQIKMDQRTMDYETPTLLSSQTTQPFCRLTAVV